MEKFRSEVVGQDGILRADCQSAQRPRLLN